MEEEEEEEEEEEGLVTSTLAGVAHPLLVGKSGVGVGRFADFHLHVAMS